MLKELTTCAHMLLWNGRDVPVPHSRKILIPVTTPGNVFSCLFLVDLCLSLRIQQFSFLDCFLKMSGMDDIKAQLYVALSKNGYGPPEYRYFCENDGRQYFRCECLVKGVENVYVANETAQKKRDAQTKAAMSMSKWLVKHGYLRDEEVPQLSVDHAADGKNG